MADPTTKAELLAMMQRGYTTFEALLAPLKAEQMTTAGVNADWSIKDILVHLVTWHRRAAQSLEAAQRNEEPQLKPPVNTSEEMNQFNDATYDANRTRPLPEVQQEFRTSYQQFVACVEASSEEALFDPQRFPWMTGHALWELVAGNAFGHYEEHIAPIEEWLARQTM